MLYVPKENSEQKRRFAELLSVGIIMEKVGWGVVVLGAIVAISGLVSCIEDSGMLRGIGAISFSAGLLTAAFGYLVVAFAQVLSCFVSMEQNTHKTVELLNELKSQLPDFNTSTK